MSVDGELAAFAEDPQAFVGTGPDEERLLTDRYCLTFGPGRHFWSMSVQRVRFGAGGVEDGVAEVREAMAARGWTAAAWAVGPSATPAGIVDRLAALGLEPESVGGSAILVLTRTPGVRGSPFEVRLVSTPEEHLAAIEVEVEGFGYPEHDAEDARRRAPETFRSERTGGHVVRMLVLDGARPVATGRAWPCPLGLYLGGGATIPPARGRGAMSALIAEAWAEAERRATPALVTHGGAMAAPTLERLGFRSLGRIAHLIDRP